MKSLSNTPLLSDPLAELQYVPSCNTDNYGAEKVQCGINQGCQDRDRTAQDHHNDLQDQQEGICDNIDPDSDSHNR